MGAHANGAAAGAVGAPFYVRVQAPFAGFQSLMTGPLRPTAPTLPHSTAWGFLMNAAAIDARLPEYEYAESRTVSRDAVPLRLAIGSRTPVLRGKVMCHYHGYPVSPNPEKRAQNHGSKHQILPVMREFLIDTDFVIGVQAPNGFRERLESGLRGELPRYGMLVLGNSENTIDSIDVLDQAPEARWMDAVPEYAPPRASACRLTVSIDRMRNYQTVSKVFAPTEPMKEPPSSAWTWTPNPPT